MNYRKGLQILIMAMVLVGIGMLSAGAQEPASNPAQQWKALQDQFKARYYQDRDYAGAERAARQALALAERTFGREDGATALSLTGLAMALQSQSRYREAEPLYRRALAIAEKVLGAEHHVTVLSLNNLAGVLEAQGRYREAEPLYRRALAIREKVLGAEHPDTAASLNNLAGVLKAQGRYREAEPFYRRALAIYEKNLGDAHPVTAISLNNLALVLQTQGHYGEAELLHRRALAIREKVLGRHLDTAASLNNLASVLRLQGRYGEAEPLQRRALAIQQELVGDAHPDTILSLNNLATILRFQGQSREAELLYRSALEIQEKVPGAVHPVTAGILNNLALVLQAQGRYGEAESFFRRALAIREKVGAEHPDTAGSLNNLAGVLRDQGRPEEAEPLYRRALAINEKVLGTEHPDTAGSLNNLAAVLLDQSRYGEAEPLFNRALAIVQQAEAPEDLLVYSRNLGLFLVKRGRLQEAVPHYRTAIDTLDRLFAYTQGWSEEARQSFLEQYAYVYREFIDLLLKLHEQDPKAGYDREVLAVASRNQSRIFSELLRQADVQKFSAEPAFVELKSRREALQQQLAFLLEKRAKLSPKEATAEMQRADLQRQIDQAKADLSTVERQLWDNYPRFMELVQPKPVTVEQLQQRLLRPEEALLSIVLLPKRTVLLAVTQKNFTLRTVPVSEKAITERVGKIHQPLEQVAQLDKLDPEELYKLYQDLIAPVEDTLHGAQRVLVVADGALYNLPLEMLVTAYGEPEQRAFRQAHRDADGSSAEHPQLGEYAKLQYLADRYRFSYLPSLAALVSQRNYPKPPAPLTRNLVAFADPLFEPEQGKSPAKPASAATKGYSDATQATLQLLARSGNVQLPRLPETADEVRAEAQLVGANTQLYLRDQAQEYTAKDLAQKGDLSGLRYLVFSTHGLLGGEFLAVQPAQKPERILSLDRPFPAAPVEKRGQPALALTLVGDLHGEDGLLTMSEVLGLDINTDLVVLSACNTAGEKPNQGEGFVGLTRSFLYAGARRLLVSHWPVGSESTRDLMVVTFTQLQAGQTPLDALTEARRQLRGRTWNSPSGPVSLAHPYFWAPFVVVGD
jgi:CHAT domain-containing protein/Tfp pilus assembly protein PilF